jgi:hypothetical protein
MNRLPVRLFAWLLALAIFPIPPALIPLSSQVEGLGRTTFAALSQKAADVNLAERILVRLEKAEQRETDAWYRDDIRIAWITTLWSQNGVPEWSWHRDSSPHVAATYQVLHCRPDEVWPLIEARRKAMLGAEYSEIFPAAASVPKKPCVGVGLRRNRKAA